MRIRARAHAYSIYAAKVDMIGGKGPEEYSIAEAAAALARLVGTTNANANENDARTK